MPKKEIIVQLDNAQVVKTKWSGYRIIFPIKNKDGSINWFNLFTGGSWGNLIFITIIVLLICGSVWAYQHDIRACIDTLNYAIENPCEWCEIIRSMEQADLDSLIINMTQIQEHILPEG